MIATARIESPAQGIYHDVPYSTYATWDAINVSRLKWSEKSAKHLRAALDGCFDADDSPDRRFGRAAHAKLLETNRFEWRFPVAGPCCSILKSGQRKGEPCGGASRFTLDGNWFCGTHRPEAADEPEDFVSPSEMADVEALSKSVKSHPVVKLLRSHGGCEVSLVTDIDGVRMKCRLDKLTYRQAEYPPCILDLKKCGVGKIRTDDCRKAVLNYGYHAQAACYREAIRSVQGEECEVFLVFVEDGPPYDVNVIHLEEQDLSIGLSDLHRWLHVYKESIRTGAWPGCCDEFTDGGLPEWFIRQYAGSVGV